MKFVVVTGGAGFIGSNFVHYMLERYLNDYHIINIDKLTYAGNLENLRDVENDKRYTFIQADICDFNAIDVIFANNQIDYVIHFAAESHVDRSIQSEFSKEFVDTNVVGTYTMLEVARRHNVSKYIQISTDEVYGSLGPTGKFTEQSPLKPSSVYSSSKTSGDLLALSYYTTYGMPVMVTRCSNNYGPYQFPEKLIPLAITNLLEGKKIPIYGQGMNTRDWIHVFDHCSAIDCVLHYGKPGEAYNIGSNNERKNIEIAHIILEYFGLRRDWLEFVPDRLGHDWRYAIDFSKLHNEIGWKPHIEFENGIYETIDWYRNNLDWWSPLKKK